MWKNRKFPASLFAYLDFGASRSPFPGRRVFFGGGGLAVSLLRYSVKSLEYGGCGGVGDFPRAQLPYRTEVRCGFNTPFVTRGFVSQFELGPWPTLDTTRLGLHPIWRLQMPLRDTIKGRGALKTRPSFSMPQVYAKTGIPRIRS